MLVFEIHFIEAIIPQSLLRKEKITLRWSADSYVGQKREKGTVAIKHEAKIKVN